jgi:hypothetical protein
MLPDDFYSTYETDDGTSPRHTPFLPVVGRESMDVARQRRKISDNIFSQIERRGSGSFKAKEA